MPGLVEMRAYVPSSAQVFMRLRAPARPKAGDPDRPRQGCVVFAAGEVPCRCATRAPDPKLSGSKLYPGYDVSRKVKARARLVDSSKGRWRAGGQHTVKSARQLRQASGLEDLDKQI